MVSEAQTVRSVRCRNAGRELISAVPLGGRS